MKYQDLVYFGYDWDADAINHQTEFMKTLRERFPMVEFKDAYDSIKGYRQEVYLPEEESDNYFSWLLGYQWFEFSLTLQLIMMSPEKKEEFEKYFALAKKQYPQEFKPESL